MTNQPPIVGTWYIGLTGKLMKVIFVCYTDDDVPKVAIEYLSGRREVITVQDWGELDLEVNIFNALGHN